MIIEIISRTPIWVFALFIFLVVLGYSQTKHRIINIKRTFILPICMFFLSLHSMSVTFGITPIGITTWILVCIMSLWICIKFSKKPNIELKNNLIDVPGSWLPLILIISLFSIKYTIGILTVHNNPMINDIRFSTIMAALFGFFNAVFLYRNWFMWITFINTKLANSNFATCKSNYER